MKKPICFALSISIFLSGCAGRTANPVPAYLPGDENRSCEAYQAEIALLDADMQRIMPDTNKFGYNTVCAAAGVFTLGIGFVFMDLKDAEKTEWEAMRVRRNRLLVYAAEKGCDFGGKGLPDKILSLKEAKELVKKLEKEEQNKENLKP